ncbi:hypothetical protein NCCP2495_15000 [Dietzia sp. NCCP-2495]|uniref:hypothetical protein n=1 Tax=Dietzia sp. NCCP-2495 TaxID=2934675 RepID=UPI0022317009|nr:hypothetical protein [Dietzia sp. NCCP-2495]GLB63621.1 hypothetical protein NCCP2495_15000 [Dietzia sp. NCCP-2495]
MTSRTFARSAAVLGAATALTIAGAGAAMAATNDSAVDGNTVSVTFELESGQLGDTCGAVLTPTSAAPALAARLADGNIVDIIDTLVNDDNVTVLRDGSLPNTILVPLVNPSGTVTATDVPSNVYAIVSFCLSDPTNPAIEAPVLVGDPMEAIQGSIGGLSSDGDALGTLSAVMGGEGGGDTGSDIGAMLGGGLDTGSAGE